MCCQVSIIIPIYNTRKYLTRCIESVLGQSFADFELLLIDDGSTDGSGEVCDMYAEKDNRVRVFHKENGGVSSARNLGLDNAKGDFVSWVDSDDWLEPMAIEMLMEKQKQTNADIVSGNLYIHKEDGIMELMESHYSDKKELLLCQLDETWNMNTFEVGRVFRRSLYEENHIRCKKGCNYAEDRYMVVRLFYYANMFVTIDSFLYNYEKRYATSITTSQQNNVMALFRNQYQHLQNWLAIRDFFSDKGDCYYRQSLKNVVKLMGKYLDWTLRFNSKERYQEIVDLIDDNEDCFVLLGWRKKGIKGTLLHNYGYMWLKYQVRRTNRWIVRKLSVRGRSKVLQ